MVTTSPLKSSLAHLARVPGVQGALIAGHDGLLVTGSFPQDQAEALSALATTVYGATEGAAEVLDKLGEVDSTMIEATEGAVHLMPAGSRLLLVMAGTTTNLGVLKLEMRRVAETIARQEDA